MSKKVLTVATAVQKAALENVLLQEIATGFWKDARPADHADNWKGVEIAVGTKLGAEGFEIPRNYNFVNPDFFKKNEAKLLAAGQTVQTDLNTKQLKKALIELNQILGGRITEVGGAVTKLARGRKQVDPADVVPETKAKPAVKKAAAVFAAPTAEAQTKELAEA